MIAWPPSPHCSVTQHRREGLAQSASQHTHGSQQKETVEGYSWLSRRREGGKPLFVSFLYKPVQSGEFRNLNMTIIRQCAVLFLGTKVQRSPEDRFTGKHLVPFHGVKEGLKWPVVSDGTG